MRSISHAVICGVVAVVVTIVMNEVAMRSWQNSESSAYSGKKKKVKRRVLADRPANSSHGARTAHHCPQQIGKRSWQFEVLKFVGQGTTKKM